MSELRNSLRSSVAASTAPYGYTLTVWASGATAISLLGTPDLPDVLLLMAGAVCAFVSIETFAYGSLASRIRVGPPPQVTVWGSAHWISSGLAILAVWATDHRVHGLVAWALSGLLATAIYLLVNSTQVALARRRVTPRESARSEVTESPRPASLEPRPGPARRTADRG